MTLAIPAATPAPVIVSVSYSGDAVTWAKLFDNQALGWLVDESGGTAPVPLMIGTLPPAAESDIASPQWGEFVDPYIAIPDQARMEFSEFLTWLATNNGASRKLGSGLLSPALANHYQQWAALNPDLAFEGDPPAADEPPADVEPAVEHHAPEHNGRRRARHGK